MDSYIYKNETYQIIGAAMSVHRTLGCGFTEKVYQEALEVELNRENIPYVRETPIHVQYKGIELSTEFIPDFICYDKIIVELKAVKELDDIHRAQTINYGKVAKAAVALLINFGETSLKYERFGM
ncbi:MAG: GxxExxY protein [Bacteroidaceae bacterium]|nr:GxxExxY protein [Bacteroidaceae bacterium]